MGKDTIQLNGVVKECFPNTTFKVECDNGHELIAYLAGKMRRYYIRVLPGDNVTVEISPYDLSKGRIVRRISAAEARRAQEEAEAGAAESEDTESSQ